MLIISFSSSLSNAGILKNLYLQVLQYVISRVIHIIHTYIAMLTFQHWLSETHIITVVITSAIITEYLHILFLAKFLYHKTLATTHLKPTVLNLKFCIIV